LDPVRDFIDLLDLASRFQSHKVRGQAIARLRTHPRFLAVITEELESGAADKGLAFLECALLSAPERQHFAIPAFNAMQRYAEQMQGQLNHLPAARKKGSHRWSKNLFGSVAKKLANCGVDFVPASVALDNVFMTKPKPEK
jgi:hypothetical protein